MSDQQHHQLSWLEILDEIEDNSPYEGTIVAAGIELFLAGGDDVPGALLAPFTPQMIGNGSNSMPIVLVYGCLVSAFRRNRCAISMQFPAGMISPILAVLWAAP